MVFQQIALRGEIMNQGTRFDDISSAIGQC